MRRRPRWNGRAKRGRSLLRARQGWVVLHGPAGRLRGPQGGPAGARPAPPRTGAAGRPRAEEGADAGKARGPQSSGAGFNGYVPVLGVQGGPWLIEHCEVRST